MDNVNKIKSDPRLRKFDEKTTFWELLRYKYLTFYFFKRVCWAIFRLVLLIGISYVVLFPYIAKIAGSFMSREDFVDVMVKLIPKYPTLDTYKAIINDNEYFKALFNTTTLSLLCGVAQMLTCAVVGYGLSKFKFKGRNIIFLLVILTMIVPHQTLQLSMFMRFRYFDILGIVRFFKGGGIQVFGHNIKNISPGVAGFFEKINILPDEIKLFKYTEYVRGVAKPAWKVTMKVTSDGINLINTYIPMILLSLGGLAFKNGLYIFMLRQFFNGVPDALEESAYIDGSGTFRTFLTIILPLSIPMMVTVFLFAFCWQWTDDFYTEMFFTSSKIVLMPDIVDIPSSLKTDYAGQNMYYAAIRNTCGLCIILPLVILYAFCQRFLVQGIEQSGLAN